MGLIVVSVLARVNERVNGNMSCVVMGLMVVSVLARVNGSVLQPPPPQCEELYGNISTETKQGGQSVVHFANYITDQKKVAIKTFKREDEFNWEHDVLSKLTKLLNKDGRDNWLPKHYPPCIMSGKKYPSLVTEYVQERFSFSNNTPLSKLVDILHQLLWAVARLHSMGYVHNDLKEGNIRMTAKGQVKLIDFGMTDSISKPFDRNSVKGTPIYMPPEMVQWNIETYYNGLTEEQNSAMPISQIYISRLDCWSLGIIAFKILTKSPIYNAQKMSEMEKCMEDDKSNMPEDHSDLKIYGQYFYVKENILKKTRRTKQENGLANNYPIIDNCQKFPSVRTVVHRFTSMLKKRIIDTDQYRKDLDNDIDNLWTIVNGFLQFENNERSSVRQALVNPIFERFVGQAVIMQRTNCLLNEEAICT